MTGERTINPGFADSLRSRPMAGSIHAASLALALAFGATAPGPAGDDFVPGQIVWGGGSRELLDLISARYALTWIDYIPELGAHLLASGTSRDVREVSAEISQINGVSYCEPNFILNSPEPVQQSQPFVDFVGGIMFKTQEAASALTLSGAHEHFTGNDVTVAIIDGGVNFDHPLLRSVVVSGADYVDSDSLAFDEPGGANSGHGTFVAGIVHLAAPDAPLRAYRVLDTSGAGDGFSVARSIVRATNDGCQVVNLSLVMSGQYAALADALGYARANNVTLVAAAGNDNTEPPRFPASDERTIAVAALDSALMKSDFSNYGELITISAPGTDIYGPFLDTSYAFWNGSSFAAPFVSGQAALIYSARPDAVPDFVRGMIRESAEPIDSLNPGLSGKLGAGLLNPDASLLLTSNLVCGDANFDGSVNISDITFLISHMFAQGAAPRFRITGDPNGDGRIDIADVTNLIARIFSVGAVPVCVFD
ncbi:MAG: S8 family serine peptidase [Candidatus Zixiibacteriota bacterium]